MHVVYARRRTYQHKLIKFGVLLVFCVVFLCVFGVSPLLRSDEASSSSVARETHVEEWSSGVAARSGVVRSLKAGDASCVKPGSRGDRASICAYIASNCAADSNGYIDYLHVFYCSSWLGGHRALGWVTFVAWILFLFWVLGVISNDYFVPALTSVAYTCSIPAEVAGLTLLAFGNGAPNVAGYFAAVTTKTFDLAIGDALGGTFFVIAVVLASVCIFGRNILLDGHSFVRDILFLGVAVVAIFVFIWTGRFYIYESIALLLLYLVYVLWASIYDLMRQRKERLALKRAAAAAGASPLPSKRSYRSRSSVFKKQIVERLNASIPSILDVDSPLSRDKQLDAAAASSSPSKRKVNSHLDTETVKNGNGKKLEKKKKDKKKDAPPPSSVAFGDSTEVPLDTFSPTFSPPPPPHHHHHHHHHHH